MMLKTSLAILAVVGLSAGLATGAQAANVNLFTGAAPAYATFLEDFDSGGYTAGTPIAPGSALHGSGAYSGATFSSVTDTSVETGSLPLNYVFDAVTPNNTQYGSVFAGGSLTITLGAAAHYFGINWGSVDDYNTITFKDFQGNTIESFNGANLSGDGKTAQYANFTTPFGIRSIVLTSLHNSFEFDDLKVASVPLPAALPLFGAALAAIGAGKMRRRKTPIA